MSNIYMGCTAFQIAEMYMPKTELVSLAKTVLLAQDLREDSWSVSKVKYNLTIVEASEQAVNKKGLRESLSSIVIDLNLFHWNEVQGWAQAIIADYAPQTLELSITIIL